eukprot:TRINITY_DN9025_c0_g1_i1.p2 TRINITY_DN9025_c0_g1~~TRINITY_DN9025_c0_g1_i1.p2  ORF type:complete len:130 (-),score=33.84 TRINITY_DN9025_c0_g1_i1:180-569(-)
MGKVSKLKKRKAAMEVFQQNQMVVEKTPSSTTSTSSTESEWTTTPASALMDVNMAVAPTTPSLPSGSAMQVEPRVRSALKIKHDPKKRKQKVRTKKAASKASEFSERMANKLAKQAEKAAKKKRWKDIY